MIGHGMLIMFVALMTGLLLWVSVLGGFEIFPGETMKYRFSLGLGAVLGLAVVFGGSVATAQKGNEKKGSGIDSKDMLKPAPRPKRSELPPSKLPLQLVEGERVALVGNSTAERMNLFGTFERSEEHTSELQSH